MKRADGEATHVEIDAADLALMFEGIDLEGAKRRKRHRVGSKVERRAELSSPSDHT
jgi:hypothetical protein